jgi:hypothetical protein
MHEMVDELSDDVNMVVEGLTSDDAAVISATGQNSFTGIARAYKINDSVP